MRLSRWGWSPYETDDDRAAEAEVLSPLVEVVPDRSDAEIVVVHSKIPAGPSLLEAAPSLQLLVTTTSGTDHIDLAAMRDAGVTVCRLPLVRRDAVVEAAIGMLIWGLRGFGVMDDWAQRGEWGRPLLPQLEPRLIRSAVVGVVGLGVIGSQVARSLGAMGAEVWGTDPRGGMDGVKSATVAEMVRSCDAVSLHCDLNPSSENIISGGLLNECSPKLVLVNTARGRLVDTRSALAAVHAGRLAGLGLDVFPQEPTDLKEFAQHPRVFVSPHSAGYHAGLGRMVREGLVRTVSAWIRRERLLYSVE